MVHQTRTPSKAIPAKHLSPMRTVESSAMGKYAASSSPADNFLRNSRLSVNGSGSTGGSSASLYKYNNMVNNNREQFNSLHFC